MDKFTTNISYMTNSLSSKPEHSDDLESEGKSPDQKNKSFRKYQNKEGEKIRDLIQAQTKNIIEKTQEEDKIDSPPPSPKSTTQKPQIETFKDIVKEIDDFIDKLQNTKRSRFRNHPQITNQEFIEFIDHLMGENEQNRDLLNIDAEMTTELAYLKETVANTKTSKKEKFVSISYEKLMDKLKELKIKMEAKTKQTKPKIEEDIRIPELTQSQAKAWLERTYDQLHYNWKQFLDNYNAYRGTLGRWLQNKTPEELREPNNIKIFEVFNLIKMVDEQISTAKLSLIKAKPLVDTKTAYRALCKAADLLPAKFSEIKKKILNITTKIKKADPHFTKVFVGMNDVPRDIKDLIKELLKNE